MKKMVVIISALAFFGLNAFAADGDLIVNGNLNVAGTLTAPNVMSKYYDSGPQTISQAGTLTLTHGLGTTPILVMAFLQCVSAEHGYAANDMVPVYIQADDGAYMAGASVVATSNYLNVKFSNVPNPYRLVHKTAGTRVFLTNASWKVVFRAWAM